MENEVYHEQRLNGQYRITGKLGRGGFGTTYAGEDLRTGRTVAIKEIPGTYHREAETEASVMRLVSSDPASVTLLDTFEEAGNDYIVMEHFPRGSVAAAIRKGERWKAEKAFRQFLPLMRVLRTLHAKKILHNDISPDNILIDADGHLVLADYGAACEYVAREQTGHTAIKDAFAPVEASCGKETGPWSDVYSLSACLYAVMTGKAPETAALRLLYDETKTPSKLGIRMPKELERILMKGLAVHAEDRYQNFEEMEQGISDAFCASRRRRRKRGLLVAAVSAVTLLLVVLTRRRLRDDPSEGIWQDPSSTSLAGALQQPREKIEDDAVTVRLRSYVPDYSEGDWIDTETALKQRLDAIGDSYAFGTEQTDADMTILLRLHPEHLDPDVLQLLTSSGGLCLFNRGYNLGVGPEDAKARVQEYADGACALQIDIREDLAPYAEYLAKNEEGVQSAFIQLGPDADSPMLTAVSEMQAAGSVTFTSLYGTDTKYISAEDKWLADLVCTMLNGVQPKLFYMYDAILDEDGNPIPDAWRLFGLSPDDGRTDYADLAASIQTLDPAYEVSFGDRSVRVELHLEPDAENFPERFLEDAKRIFEICNLPESCLQRIEVFPVEEHGEEMCRLLFEKIYPLTASEGLTEEDLALTADIYGKDFLSVQEKLHLYMEQDGFYQELLSHPYSNANFDMP